MNDLKIEYVSANDLTPYENNAREHHDEDIGAIVNSIREFGFNDPIGVWGNNNTIVEGHGRLLAAQSIGMEKVPVIHLNGLTDEQRRAYALAHNKTAELSDWDFSTLESELADIEIDMEQFWFDVKTEDQPTEIIEDDVPENAEPRCKLGDLWQLGDHKLICGDSTDSAVIDRLMDGVRADITLTSPPYNADHMDVPKSDARGGGTQKSTQKKYLADNDKRTDAEYIDFLCNNMDLMLANSEEVFYNIGVGAGSKIAITKLLNHYASQFKDLIYWVTDNPRPVIVESVISSATELIMCFGENGSRSFNHFNDRMFHGVINGHSAAVSNKYADIHKATFPIYLPSEIISRFTPNNGTVIDCFGGTGTTMIACEQLNRKCYMVELDPTYCDVIIERWENLTGEKAIKL